MLYAMLPKVSEPLLNRIYCINLDKNTCNALMLPKLENKTQTGTIVYTVLLIINCSTYVYNICIYSVQRNKAFARLNIVHQQSSCSAAIWHGTEHVSDAYSTVSTHLCLHFILKNYAKSKLDSK